MDLSLFLYQVFCHHKIIRRRQIIRLWHSPFLGFDAKRHKRPAHVFADFITTILYEPTVLKITRNHFCCFDRGSQVYQVPHSLLDHQELDYLDQLLQQNKVKRYLNGDFVCQVADAVTEVKQTWRRELVREFAWQLLAKQSCYLLSEMICAVQSLMLVKKGDLFLAALHFGLQNTSVIKEVPCWHLDWYDWHEEDFANQAARLDLQKVKIKP
jgi:hypothetical protein